MPASNPMQLGMVGLGRMGAGLVGRLTRDGHSCVVYDVNPDAVKAMEQHGATGSGRQGILVVGNGIAAGGRESRLVCHRERPFIPGNRGIAARIRRSSPSNKSMQTMIFIGTTDRLGKP